MGHSAARWSKKNKCCKKKLVQELSGVQVSRRCFPVTSRKWRLVSMNAHNSKKSEVHQGNPNLLMRSRDLNSEPMGLHFNVHKGAYLFETPAHVTVVQLCVWPKPPLSPQQHPKVWVRSACQQLVIIKRTGQYLSYFTRSGMGLQSNAKSFFLTKNMTCG